MLWTSSATGTPRIEPVPVGEWGLPGLPQTTCCPFACGLLVTPCGSAIRQGPELGLRNHIIAQQFTIREKAKPDNGGEYDSSHE